MSTYNVQDFLKESLDSIVNQSYKNLEIIIVDDGSTDSTVSILKSYALKDDRIILVLKDRNSGLASSRNYALKRATGKYVTFLDGDDIYDKDLINKAVEIAEKDQSDMVIWDYQVFSSNFELIEFKRQGSMLSHVNGEDKIELLQIPAFTWIKLLKTQKVRELNIHFPDGRTRQDIPVHWHLITMLKKISILPEKLSYYRQQSQATTHQNDSRLFDLAYVMDMTKENLKRDGVYDIYKNEFIKQRLNLLFGMYDRVINELKQKALVIIRERLSDEEWKYIYGGQDLRFQARCFFRSLHGDKLSLIKYKIWLIFRHIYRAIKSNKM